MIKEVIHLKYYHYSVKDILTDYFGEDTVFAMRKPHESVENPTGVEVFELE